MSCKKEKIIMKRSGTQIVLVVLIACLLVISGMFYAINVREHRRELMVTTTFESTAVALLNNAGYMVTIHGTVKNKMSYDLSHVSLKVVVRASGSSFTKTYHYENITIMAGEEHTVNQTVLTTAGYNQVDEVAFQTQNRVAYAKLSNPYSVVLNNAMLGVMIALMASILLLGLLESSRIRKQNQLAYEKAERAKYEAQQLSQNFAKVQTQALSFDDRIKKKKKQPVCDYCGTEGEPDSKRCPSCGAKYK